jgi:hypothetical protein
MFLSALSIAALLAATPASATGRATCDSGPEKDWQASETLTRQLEAKGWKVRRVKVDGGCYEVYALDEKGQRVEVYFHPKTLEPVPAKPR